MLSEVVNNLYVVSGSRDLSEGSLLDTDGHTVKLLRCTTVKL